MEYLYIKALHIVSLVSWFAGLFYIVRLYIYDVEAEDKQEPARTALQSQLRLMERRLWYGITVPAMIATTVFGVWLMFLTSVLKMPWFHLKLSFLVVLYGYHFVCGGIRKDLAGGRIRWTSKGLRIWNEVATILLFAIVFAAVLKSLPHWGYGMIGFCVFALLLVTGLLASRKLRNR